MGALAVGGTGLLPSTAQARQPSAAPDSARQQQFTAAAAKYHVPTSVLLSVAYQESAWESHDGLPSRSGGYGPMHLTDVTPAMLAGGDAGLAGRSELASAAGKSGLHTLRAAAKATGLPVRSLRSDAAANIQGGAALLAAYERELVGDTPADPGQWYGAVARYSQAEDGPAAAAFAQRVYKTIVSGAARQTLDGQEVRLTAAPDVRPAAAQLNRLHLSAAAATADTECPPAVRCTFLQASARSLQVSDRPANGIRIDTIVIHDTESSYDSTVTTFQNPTSTTSAHYVMRSADGAVTQMVPTKDIAFHAGNYSTNLHSIGIEHEGYAVQGATWYTEAQYEATAYLVKYLSMRYDIPLDRQHILGHDNVAGPASGYVSGMHWDPGTSWDWQHFMDLLGAPLEGDQGVGRVGSAVTITPGFATNLQTVQVCPSDDPTGNTVTCTDQQRASNFVYLRKAPDPAAPLFGDQATHGSADGTDRINDWGSTAQAGQQFVVADKQGDWTAIWYSGTEVWFYNPDGLNTTPAHGVQVIEAAGTAPVAVYGSSYPDLAEYPAGFGASTQAPLNMYSVPAGQAYVAAGPATATDDYSPSTGAVLIGAKKMYTIQYNHRVALVYADSVSASTVPSDD
ncbi:N-acetylmuramoyl-L-alanine amidase [Streptomyces fuscichromogenes]|uniref:N-acetylmuramoyl-L-alanine amidase n=1 Tax=Streptomyces fuscichromogenes TaxID=1324013 RepID=UPI0038233D83